MLELTLLRQSAAYIGSELSQDTASSITFIDRFAIAYNSSIYILAIPNWKKLNEN